MILYIRLDKKEQKEKEMKRYYKHIRPYWIYFVLSPILMLIEVFSDVMLPTLSAEIINVGVANSSSGDILFLAVKMVFFVTVAVLTGVGASYCATKASVNFSSDVREELFAKIQEFSFANIDKYSTGSLITRLTNDITQLQQFTVMCLRMAFRAPGMLVGAIFMSYMISGSLSVVYMMLVPVLALIIYITIYLSYSRFNLLQVKIDGLNSKIQEMLINIRVIKALKRESYEEERFEVVNDELKKSGLRAYKITILQLPLMTLAINAATILILWLGSQLLNTGDIEIGDISALVTYLTQILASVNMIAMVFLQSSRAVVSNKRIVEVLETEINITNVENEFIEKEVLSGNITFEHVNFKYYKNNHELVLEDLNFEIKSGETVGVIGSTGCGKTSLVNLIPRLYDVHSGAVYVDGVDVRNYSLEKLRDGVAVVLQNNCLFTGSIRDNLKWGDMNANEEAISDVVEWSAAGEFVYKKADGLDDRVEQGGLNLSGGQKQRLCIARALLKEPKILILDDSTSAVDTATEAKITGHLNGELKETTKIIIAQRVSSVRNADKIIVMNDGKIEAIGTHLELLESSITYQEICYSQMDKEELA